jgi:hypothetical protein
VQNFLDLPGPSTLPAGKPGASTRPGAGAAAGAAGAGAVADFLNDSGAKASQRPSTGNRPAAGERRDAGQRPGAENRQDRRTNLAQNQPNRIENRQQWQNNRQQRRSEVRNQVAQNYPRLDFWTDHPNWAAWRINRPYRWATWAAITGWVGYGWSQPSYYNYGENIYYAEDQVVYGDQPAATADEYAQQAETIATTPPEVPADKDEWMSLGVFAITQDGQATGAPPTMFLQLVVSKKGVIAGTFTNKAADGEPQALEGMVDKKSQRAAWVVSGQKRPLMETGIYNLTQDTAPALVHFDDGTTQQRLLVRMDEPKQQQ